MNSTFIEIVRSERPFKAPRAAMFDFDGTVSLIREGWHKMLLEMDLGYLRQTPKGRSMPEDELREKIKGFLEPQIGKQTIFQFYALSDAIRELGGTPDDPERYNRQYMELLDGRVQPRLEGLRNGEDPRELVVPGTFEILEMFRCRGVKLYLVSGTDDPLLKIDAELLGVTKYFDGGVYGGQKDPKMFSKAMIVEKILRENDIQGEELIGFGDGHTETEDVRNVGGFTVGVASNETTRQGVDAWKRDQLVRSGADWIIPDFSDVEQIERRIFDR